MVRDVLAVETDPAEIWRLWGTCLQHKPALSLTPWPQIVGLVLDAHMARATAGVPLDRAYNLGLAPMQQGGSLHIGADIASIVQLLWERRPSSKKACGVKGAPLLSLPFAKLVDKGMINPKSVRYISPQITRCGSCPRSKSMVMRMLKAWLLGSYPHRETVADPGMRALIHTMPFERLLSIVRQQPSKHLYCIVAECIAAVSVADPVIHIMAASSNPNFAAYVEAVCRNASVIATSTLKLLASDEQPLKRRRRSALARVTFATAAVGGLTRGVAAPHRVVCIPTTAAVKALQRAACLKMFGFANMTAFACHHCGIVHGAVKPKTRGHRTVAGVALNLERPADVCCNVCGRAASALELAGVIAMSRATGAVTTCCRCATLVSNPSVHGESLYCAECYGVVESGVLQRAVCSCGAPPSFRASGDDAFVAGQTVYMPCPAHIAAVPSLKAAGATRSAASCNAFFLVCTNQNK